MSSANNLQLKDPDLLREAMLIDGQWVQAENGQTIEVRNPATGELVARVPNGGERETQRAVAAAERAMKSWRKTLPKERSKVLRKLFDLMLENIDDLAIIMTAEQGKPLVESRGEILYAAGFIEWFAEEAKRIYGDIIPHNVEGRQILVQKAPIGVFAAITPWNFPSAMITRKAGPG
ncbi:MAG: aldehyde dehydrogenase family protein, partial [Alcaligenes sp.]